MRIDLRCCQTRMPQNFFNGINVSAPIQQMGGKGMTQNVWTSFINSSDHI